MFCFCCGKELKEEVQGRPKTYCGKDCREAIKYLNAFKKKIEEVELSKEANRELRGDLMSFINTSLPPSRKTGIGTKKRTR